MNGDPADVVANHFTFPSMETRANINSEWTYFLGNSAGAANTACRTIECSEYSVAGRFDFSAPKPSKIAPDRSVMIVKQITPAAVAERDGLFSRANDVGKENGSKHPVDFYRRS